MSKVDEVVIKMQEEIEKIKEFAKEKTNEIVDDETKEKIHKLVQKTADVIENTKDKVIEVAKDAQDDEKFNAFLNNVSVKVCEACEFAKDKIVEMVPEKEQLDDIQKQINESFDKLKDNKNVKTVVVNFQKVEDTIKDYINKPETQEKIKKAKKTTLNIAEKGMDHLRKLLQTDEEIEEIEAEIIEDEDTK